MNKRLKKLLLLSLVGAPLFALSLFVVNGLCLGHGEVVVLGETSAVADESPSDETITVVSLNVAKMFIHKGGVDFESEAVTRERLADTAERLKVWKPDFVFLSEIVQECGRCPVDQVAELAAATDMPFWAFGENYNFGLPIYRIVGGNAILSRRPLTAEANQTLTGRKPFWVTKNNRRTLWCSAMIDGREILLASVHHDSFDIENNLKQTGQLLEFAGDRLALIAGDFNANPSQRPIQLLKSSGQFVGEFDGPGTFPADKPTEQIDFILGPADWEVVSHEVVTDSASDHCLVCTTFKLAPE